jgi:hypothetical protein
LALIINVLSSAAEYGMRSILCSAHHSGKPNFEQ